MASGGHRTTSLSVAPRRNSLLPRRGTADTVSSLVVDRGVVLCAPLCAACGVSVGAAGSNVKPSQVAYGDQVGRVDGVASL